MHILENVNPGISRVEVISPIPCPLQERLGLLVQEKAKWKAFMNSVASIRAKKVDINLLLSGKLLGCDHSSSIREEGETAQGHLIHPGIFATELETY